MPRIDPLSLLKCLSVLLSPTGGIKSKEEVIRLANLMTKFSKKLVSKCIYIQILKSSSPELLDQFMTAGGWGLIHVWLSDGIQFKNWALIEEILELLLLCPVDVERLKTNNCPKLIKGLSKNTHMGVRTLASRLVEQWLRMVKGEAITPSASQASGSPCSTHSSVSETSTIQPYNSIASVDSTVDQNISENHKIINSSDPSVNSLSQSSPLKPVNQQQIKNLSPKSQSLSNHEKSQSPSSVFKITIRDGKEVLNQMQTDVSNINLSVNINSNINGDIGNTNNCVITDKQNTIVESERTVSEDVSKDASSEVSEVVSKSDLKAAITNKDQKENKNDVNKSLNKEIRDKKEDKKSSSVDKKSSSSKSSSKHSSSSSKHSSSKHSSSSHRSSSKSSSSSSSKDKSRDKEKDKHHSSSSSKSSSNKSKSDRDKDKDKEKEKLKKDQAEKDKATLEKLQSQTLGAKMGKIPRKKVDEERADSPSRKSSTDSKDSFKENKDKFETKKISAVPEKKNSSISIENRKNSHDANSRPKTVKTFNSKFRSTGLEEEVKSPLPRGTKKVTSVPDKKVLPPKISLKRPSPIRDSGSSIEKKPRLSLDSPTTPNDEKKGGIKLIPPKPKLVFLQESDMFMDALTASTKSTAPRKRKRRTSISKDGTAEVKKQEVENHRDGSSSPTSPPHSKDADDKSIIALKPTFKFYQDTLETDEEKDDKNKIKSEDTSIEKMDTDELPRIKKENENGSRTPTPENDFDDTKSSESPEDPAAAVSEALKKEQHDTIETRPTGVLKSVLLLQKRKGPKKSLKWKTDLESVRYFELDETERVNVTKTFTDMKQMEKMNEREAFQMARKLSSEDVMEEKTVWKALIPIDLPPPLVDPGKDSREKDIQYAREKGILQALYFNRSMIPDSAAEPEEERHPVFVEPKIIPLDDLTGNKDSEKDFSNIPWPEPKPQLPTPTPPTTMQATYFQTFRPNQQTLVPPTIATQPPMAVIPQQPMMNAMPPMISEASPTIPASTGGGGGWRTGDGKLVVPDPNLSTMPPMPNNFQNIENPSMGPPNMMTPPPQLYNNEGYMMVPEEMGFNNFQGPPGPGMYGPPGPGGPPFQGPRPPMHGNRGRGGPGWFRGGPPRGMPWRGNWRGGKQPPVCRQFSKNGYCRVGDKCQFLHPGVNCPPY